MLFMWICGFITGIIFMHTKMYKLFTKKEENEA